jgi:hypothetical protein
MADHLGRRADGEQFRVGGGVAVDFAAVVRLRDHLPIAHGDRTNRHVTVFGGAAGFVQRQVHPGFVVHRAGHYSTPRAGSEESVGGPKPRPWPSLHPAVQGRTGIKERNVSLVRLKCPSPPGPLSMQRRGYLGVR